MENNEQLHSVKEQLKILMERQEGLQADIKALTRRIEEIGKEPSPEEISGVIPTAFQAVEEKLHASEPLSVVNTMPPPLFNVHEPHFFVQRNENYFEQLIALNIGSKIGVFIILIGVIIGTKYSIEHNLVTPLARIVIGYLTGIGLLATAVRLKKSYYNFSAVLMSGALGVFYLDTFAAYNFYQFYSQPVAFAVLVILTICTVFTALYYDRQVIAHFGLVAGYAIPFLLSEHTGKAEVLFSYITLVNIGIAVIALKRNWWPIFLNAFVVTWIIFISWVTFSYAGNQQPVIALGFGVMFLIIFNTVFIASHRMVKGLVPTIHQVVLFLNAALFYGAGYYILGCNSATEDYRGLFTLLNALFNGAICYVLYKRLYEDKTVVQFVAALCLLFITLTVPVQLDGNWVTNILFIWAVILWQLEIKTKAWLYEVFAYFTICIAAISLLHDIFAFIETSGLSNSYMHSSAFFNPLFLTMILAISSLAVTGYFIKNLDPADNGLLIYRVRIVFKKIVAAALTLLIYFTFFMQFAMLFDQQYAHSAFFRATTDGGYWEYCNSIVLFKIVFLLSFSFLYIFVSGAVGNKFFSSKTILRLSIAGNYISFIVYMLFIPFFTYSLYAELTHRNYDAYTLFGMFHLLTRYFCLFLIIYIAHGQYKLIAGTGGKRLTRYENFLTVFVFWLLNAELIYLFNVFDWTFRLVFTLVWAAYALGLLVSGIVLMKKNFRMTGLLFFMLTLCKLFLYDIGQMSSLGKTIVFILVGVLILAGSFQYQRYKKIIFPEDEIPAEHSEDTGKMY
ncbi:MAG: DUF2339 domain-containing protein [Ignavibacteriales bacterium]|nr:DUF2339 domain-containing protein [Ignavibacteriales bacterium]